MFVLTHSRVLCGPCQETDRRIYILNVSVRSQPLAETQVNWHSISSALQDACRGLTGCAAWLSRPFNQPREQDMSKVSAEASSVTM